MPDRLLSRHFPVSPGPAGDYNSLVLTHSSYNPNDVRLALLTAMPGKGSRVVYAALPR
jgi:hypothetical protein